MSTGKKGRSVVRSLPVYNWDKIYSCLVVIWEFRKHNCLIALRDGWYLIVMNSSQSFKRLMNEMLANVWHRTSLAEWSITSELGGSNPVISIVLLIVAQSQKLRKRGWVSLERSMTKLKYKDGKIEAKTVSTCLNFIL